MTKLISTNPSKNYEVIGEIDQSSKEEIEEKVKLARATQKEWGSLPLIQRITHLKTLIPLFSGQKEKIAALISEEMGMPISQALLDVRSGIAYFQWYLENAEKYLQPEITFENEKSIHRVFYEPMGVVAVIVAWNFPFSNFVWQTGQNLIVGNTVVFKHSEETPFVGKEIEKVFSQSTIPHGVFNEVYGDGKIGDILVHQDINLICFTGSSKVGKELYKIGAEKFIPVLMELGGSAPGIVFEDANIDAIIETIYDEKFWNCGQICDGLKRLIVHERKFEEVVKKLKDFVERKKVGIAFEQGTDVGPLVAKRQVHLLKVQVEDALSKGATIVIGGKEPVGLNGAFYQPTLMTKIHRDMRIWKEEVFGPVLPIVSFTTYDEAMTLANDTNYGLGGYIFTENKELFCKASLDLKTGMVCQNTISYLMPSNPFGGCKQSGIGREHGKYGFHHLCQIKLVSMEK